MSDVYESQAKFFSNIPLLAKGYVASVHLENKEDKEFWIKSKRSLLRLAF